MTPRTSLSLAALALTMATGAFFLAPVSAEAQAPGDRTLAFEAMDADGDGIVTQEEFEAFLADRPRMGQRGMMRDRGAMRGMWQHGGMGFGPGAAMDEDGRTGFAARMIERFDTDGDGALSEAEIAAAMEHMAEMRNDPAARARMMFEHMDTDGDGMISPEEFETAHAAMQERMQQRAEARGGRAGKAPEHRRHRHGPRGN
ncbi:EF-hand domain-containing protein [Alkalilacustris brevis]|uniref:EF-hand domain-containing protein n=1 Tax=Alkalilacustris brevis TaxID=2026338 RepID=UPI000E0D96B9|nr:EF-hand domain-containing protein [Alkalilacustris brevis]